MNKEKIINDRDAKKSHIINEATKVLFLIFLIALGYSIFQFTNSFHSLDLGHNAIVFEEKYNLSLIDHATDYNYYSTDYLYVTGIKDLIYWYLVGLLCSFMVGIYFYYFTRSN